MVDLTRAQALAEMRSHECADSIQRQAIEQACGIVAESEYIQQLDGLDVLAIDPDKASAGLQESDYYTQSCKALLHEQVIVVNLQFLAEMEGALRAFAAAGSFYSMPQIQSDKALFDLVRKLRPPVSHGLAGREVGTPWPYLKRLRRLTTGYGAPTREGDREEDICEELSLVILFFIAHEVGHLLDGKDVRSFGAFLPPGADLEHRVANAVVKLARHVDDFERREHGLPGFEAMTDHQSDVRASVKRLEAKLGDAPAKHDEWFGEENSADGWANKLIDEHLARIDKRDGHAAARAAYLFNRGVFGVALYAWYADLLSFYDGVGIKELTTTQELVFTMMRDRENYIRAASLFGEDHRSTLMRAEVAIESVLKNRSDWFDHCHWSRSRLDTNGPESAGTAAQEKWWLEESVLRFCLLGIVVDTAVKIAHVGAAANWYEQLPGGGPPILMMSFESIDRAVSRLSNRNT